MISKIQNYLRNQVWWLKFQEARREGIYNFYRRVKIQPKILESDPVITELKGDIEIRVLTWRRDYLNMIWSLKTFYKTSAKNYPLYIHDGGLEEENIKILKKHFPNAFIILKDEADKIVEAKLRNLNLLKSIEYRKKNIATRKLWDYFLLSEAKWIIHIDSDVLFFKRPSELLDFSDNSNNCYNKDMDYAYSLTLDEIEHFFNIKMLPYINSGIFRVSNKSIDFIFIEKCLLNDKLFNDNWVTEQTLHALTSTKYGVELLPETYLVSTKSGLNEEIICKHYTGFFRPLFYQEGMVQALKLLFK